MRLNVARSHEAPRTHEGAVAHRVSSVQQLRRSVLSCLLWENQFYENGVDIADRISQEAEKVTVEQLAAIAVEARKEHNLRHVPLLLASILARRARGNPIVSETIFQIVDRADELAEFVAVYAKMNNVGLDKVKRKLSAQVKKGLARAFTKFDAYQIAKYDRDGEVKLRDVLFMVHAKPATPEQAETWKKLVDGTLEAPDTWEVNLSKGGVKKDVFERLIQDGRLGYMALLRNLRGMLEAGVDTDLITKAILARKGASRVLPFRYVAAARACPQLEPVIDQALVAAIHGMKELSGRTIILVDVSGSMDVRLSSKSDLSRMDAAATLASIIPGQRRVFSFSDRVVEVPPRHGMAGVDTIKGSQLHIGTRLGAAVAHINQIPHDRLIVITDEQSNDRVPDPVAAKAYMINVASYRNGVGYGRWTHIDGFSESVLRYIAALEGQPTDNDQGVAEAA